MSEREAKRIRQACQNCRRKKSRCSGQRPACAFCARLRQQCVYDDGRSPFFAPSTDATSLPASTNDVNLLARVALLESKLSLLGSGDTGVFGGNSDTGHKYQAIQNGSALFQCEPKELSLQPPDLSLELLRKFSTLPDLIILESAADVYFRHCHNQPYSYFHEESFRRALREGGLPSSLLLTFMATAARFSDDFFFEGRQTEAIETFARTAWHEIFERSFADEDSFNIHTAQATNMLAVIDFTAGRPKLGWVKVGLSVRFAQGLRLNAEPDSLLSPCEQEEYRRTFWSVYLLDRLVSCSPHRPPTIFDDDCTVHLPCNEVDFHDGLSVEQPTLGHLNHTPENCASKKLGWFALTIFMASALGRIVRYNLRKIPTNVFTPWDSRGEIASTWSTLLTFEAYSNPLDASFSEILDRDFVVNGNTDQQMAGHFVFAQMLYHLNQCLLHHPFLLHQRLRSYKSIVPPSFIKEVLQRSRVHAEHLTILLQNLQQRECCAHPSFFGYGAITAGLIHRLYEVAEDESTVSMAHQYYQSSLAFLDQKPAVWAHSPRMATVLRNFRPDPSTARALVGPFLPREEADVAQADLLWCLVDYGWLSDSARPVTAAPDEPYLNLDADGWVSMDDMKHHDGGLDPDLRDMFSFSSETARPNGHDDDAQDVPGGIDTSDPWSEIVNQVNMNADTRTNKEWEATWRPFVT